MFDYIFPIVLRDFPFEENTGLWCLQQQQNKRIGLQIEDQASPTFNRGFIISPVLVFQYYLQSPPIEGGL